MFQPFWAIIRENLTEGARCTNHWCVSSLENAVSARVRHCDLCVHIVYMIETWRYKFRLLLLLLLLLLIIIIDRCVFSCNSCVCVCVCARVCVTVQCIIIFVFRCCISSVLLYECSPVKLRNFRVPFK
jgi:hypothetical protein